MFTVGANVGFAPTFVAIRAETVAVLYSSVALQQEELPKRSFVQAKLSRSRNVSFQQVFRFEETHTLRNWSDRYRLRFAVCCVVTLSEPGGLTCRDPVDAYGWSAFGGIYEY